MQRCSKELRPRFNGGVLDWPACNRLPNNLNVHLRGQVKFVQLHKQVAIVRLVLALRLISEYLIVLVSLVLAIGSSLLQHSARASKVWMIQAGNLVVLRSVDSS